MSGQLLVRIGGFRTVSLGGPLTLLEGAPAVILNIIY
jgi:hypothetical protein